MARYVGTALALSCIGMVPWALWYFYPHLLSKCIATISEVLAGFKAWCTPPLLFLLMNAVVLALAFTSGFIKQRPLSRLDGEEREDLGKTRRRDNAEDYADEEEEEEQEEEDAGEDSLYPEVLSSFFGEVGMVTRRKPLVKRTLSAERKGRSSYPSLSHKFNPGPSLVANPSPRVPRHAHAAPKAATFDLNPSPSLVANPSPRVPRHAHAAPMAITFDLKQPVPAPAAAQASNGNRGNRDVDERADAFIGDFYKKMKLQQVDPYMERLERSYGR